MTEHARRRAESSLWGLRLPPGDAVHARVVEQRWRWPTMLALVATIPAFYLELLLEAPSMPVELVYLCAALVVGAALMHTGWRSGHLAEHLQTNGLDIVLVAGLLAAAVLPSSGASPVALALRLGLALPTLLRMVWVLKHLFTRGGLGYMLLAAGGVLVACGAGYWWLEPTTPTFGQGLWLAFVTAATVGYGDVVPTTPASKIFSFFVVLLGFGVLTMVTAAIATKWVETEERIIEREILRDLHQQIDLLRDEIASLRQELMLARGPFMHLRKDLVAEPGPSDG